MDTLCGIGLPELVILLLVSFVFIGPERSREIALTMGRWLRRAVTSTWWRDFNEVTSALRDLPNTLIRMSELEDSLRQMQSEINEATQIDISLDQPEVNHPPRPQPVTNSEAIDNATTQTDTPPEQPAAPPTPPEAGESHDR